MEQDYTTSEGNLLISLANFPDAQVAVSSTNSSYTSVLKSLIEDDAEYLLVPAGTSLDYCELTI